MKVFFVNLCLIKAINNDYFCKGGFMQKQIIQSTKVTILVASLISAQLAQADFGLDDALQEMMHSVEKIQRKFTKINNSVHAGVHNFMQSTFSTNMLNVVTQDAHVIITVALNDIDKDSIKAVVHNKVLTVNARDKQTEMELVVDTRSVKLSMQQKIEVASQEAGKSGEKKTEQVSVSSQQNMQSLPVEVKLDDVAIEYENNVLTVKLSRTEPVILPKVIQVTKK